MSGRSDEGIRFPLMLALSCPQSPGEVQSGTTASLLSNAVHLLELGAHVLYSCRSDSPAPNIRIEPIEQNNGLQNRRGRIELGRASRLRFHACRRNVLRRSTRLYGG